MYNQDGVDEWVNKTSDLYQTAFILLEQLILLLFLLHSRRLLSIFLCDFNYLTVATSTPDKEMGLKKKRL